MRQWIKELFSDENGQLSMTRALTFGGCFYIFNIWAITCIAKGEMVEFGSDNLYVLGMLLTGKVIQRRIEK